MDYQKTGQLLEKIQALHKNMASGGDHADPIERDLMLSYLRRLYEMYLHEDRQPTTLKKEEPPKPEPRIIDLGESDTPKQKAEPKPEPEPEPEVIPSPPPTPPIREQAREQAPPPPEPKPAAPAPHDDGAYEKLFESHKAVELGDKLSSAPVNDLKGAFAINDRLLYINELFGRNPGAFEQALQLLNRYDSLPEARAYICELAEEFDWLKEEDRLDTARAFVRTVRRRYMGG